MKQFVLMFAALLVTTCLCACGGEPAVEAPDFVCAGGHSWENATCEAPQTCSVCGITVGESRHSWQGAACDTPAACALCGITAGEAEEHAYTDWVVNQQDALFRYCALCGRAEAHDLWVLQEIMGDAYNEQVKPLLDAFRTGTWTAKLVVGSDISRCGLPEQAYTIRFETRETTDGVFLWPSFSFIELIQGVSFGTVNGLQVSELTQYAVLHTDASGSLLYDEDGNVRCTPKLLSECVCERFFITKTADESVLYDIFVYLTPEFPNGLIEVVMHEEQQRVFFTKDDPENPGENPFCRVVTD